jgi:hypothetical protein
MRRTRLSWRRGRTPWVSIVLLALMPSAWPSRALTSGGPRPRAHPPDAFHCLGTPPSPCSLGTEARGGLTIAYKRIGDFAWNRVEPRPGRFDFRRGRHDAALLRSMGIAAFPSLEFLHPPRWFLAEHLDAVIAYGGPSQSARSTTGGKPSISLAWLMAQERKHTRAWTQFAAYVRASPSGRRIAVPLSSAWPSRGSPSRSGMPWGHGPRSCTIPPGCSSRTSIPRVSPCGVFRENPPAALAALGREGRPGEKAWQEWTPRRAGLAFLALARLIHRLAPRLWISVDKFVWIRMRRRDAHPALALADGTTEEAFRDVLPYLRAFVEDRGDRKVVIDDDALMDASKDAHFALTLRLMRPLGISRWAPTLGWRIASRSVIVSGEGFRTLFSRSRKSAVPWVGAPNVPGLPSVWLPSVRSGT